MKTRIASLSILLPMLTLGAGACMETTIKTGVPVVPPKPTPPFKIEANIQLEDFRMLCNFLPEEGDQMSESESADGEKIVRLTLGNTKRRQNPAAMRAGCTPGQTFVFAGPEQRLDLNQK